MREEMRQKSAVNHSSSPRNLPTGSVSTCGENWSTTNINTAYHCYRWRSWCTSDWRGCIRPCIACSSFQDPGNSNSSPHTWRWTEKLHMSLLISCLKRSIKMTDFLKTRGKPGDQNRSIITWICMKVRGRPGLMHQCQWVTAVKRANALNHKVPF